MQCGGRAEGDIADTVVIFPPERDTVEGGEAHGEVSEILEKPINRDEQVGRHSTIDRFSLM